MKPPKFKLKRAHQIKASKLGVTVKESENPAKKLDVFLNGKKIADIGAIGYWDYQLYKEYEKKGHFPAGYADKKRSAYQARHDGEQLAKGSPGYFAWKILW